MKFNVEDLKEDVGVIFTTIECYCGEELVEIDYQPGNYVCPVCDEEEYLDLVDPYRNKY